MVVTEQDEVKAIHLARHLQCSIFFVVGGDYTAFLSAVKETDDDIRLFIGLEIVHPFTGSRNHIYKGETAPQTLCQPVGDGWSYHSQHGNLHSAAVKYSIRLEIGLAGIGIDDIGCNNRAFHFLYPFVIHLMTRLDIVVAYGLCVVLEVVHHRGGYILSCSVDVVGIVRDRLPLQYVAIVEQYHIVAMLLAQLLDITADTCHRPSHRPAVDVIVGEEAAVNITGLNNFDGDRLGFGHVCQSERKQ